MAKLPEITFDQAKLRKYLDGLANQLADFTVSYVTYIDSNSKTVKKESVADLITSVGKQSPATRSNIKIHFRFTINKRNTCVFSLCVRPDNSTVEITAGSIKKNNELAQEILHYSGSFKREITNDAARLIFAPLVGVVFISFNLMWPETLYIPTQMYTIIAAVLATPFISYFLHRPHILLINHRSDHLKIIGNKHIFSTIISMAIFTFCVGKLPTWIGRDQNLVATNPKIQNQVIREMLTPEFIEKAKLLRDTAQLYDSAKSNESKISISSMLAKLSSDLIYAPNGISSFPIGKVKLFSTMKPLDPENLLVTHPLLITRIKSQGPEIPAQLEYVPRVLVEDAPQYSRTLEISRWLDEPVIKDGRNTIWTRAMLLGSANQSFSDGLVAKNKSLQSLREEKPWQAPQGVEYASTIESATIRAIAHEIILATEEMKRSVGILPKEKIQPHSTK